MGQVLGQYLESKREKERGNNQLKIDKMFLTPPPPPALSLVHIVCTPNGIPYFLRMIYYAILCDL